MATHNTAGLMRASYESEVTAIRAEFEDSHHGRTVLQRNSALLDSIHSQLWDTYLADIPGLALVAIGGYGRGAMYPYSDVDLMFLHGRETLPSDIKDKIRRFGQDLWDMRLKLSPTTRSLKECEILHRGNLEFNHVLPAVQACADGLGFGMFFSYQVEPFIAQKRLKVVLEDFERPPRPIQAVYPHARLLPARTRAFLDWIREDLKRFR